MQSFGSWQTRCIMGDVQMANRIISGTSFYGAFISSLGNFRSDWDNEVPLYLCFFGLCQFAVFLSSWSSGISKSGKTVDIRFFLCTKNDFPLTFSVIAASFDFVSGSFNVLIKLPLPHYRPGGGGRGPPHKKGVGMLVVLLRGVNFGFWSHVGCSGQNAIIFSREGLV